jgi:hypothetical protein
LIVAATEKKVKKEKETSPRVVRHNLKTVKSWANAHTNLPTGQGGCQLRCGALGCNQAVKLTDAGLFLAHTQARNSPPTDWAIYTKLLRPAIRQSS